MILMRVRGITEHGAYRQFDIQVMTPNQGNYYTRSVVMDNPTFFKNFIFQIERVLIGSLNCNYHHEHHLFPKVPFYKLSKVHRYINKDVRERNQLVYVDGYFSTLLLTKKS